MFKFFLYVFLVVMVFARTSFVYTMQEHNFDSNNLFRSQQGSSNSLTINSSDSTSSSSVCSTQPGSPVTARTRLLTGLEDRQDVSIVVIGMPTDNNENNTDTKCHCPQDTYCRAGLYFLGYLTAAGGVGAIIMEICKAA